MAIDRRAFLRYGAAAGATLLGDGLWLPAWAQNSRGAGISMPVTTTSGRIRGLVRYGVNQFYGVPYAASTAGANRFMPPQKLAPWSGIRDCFEVGHRSPQDGNGPISEVSSLDRREPAGEDCLDVNVFAPVLGPANRPVMVWLHGGGYARGSGNWLLYDGTNLARKEDVVVVAVTHRLNLFGFLHLADFTAGEKWAHATNVGMQDLVAALTWVKENIAAFGGNPHNVTIFGQSGGGAKVTALMAMPSARGLFHRAIAQSGSTIRGIARDDASAAAEKFLAKLDVQPKQLDRLQEISLEQLQQTFSSQPPIRGLASGPVVDGTILPHDPWSPGAPDSSASVPLMMGSVATESAWNDPPPPLDMPEADMMTRMTRVAGGDQTKARELVALYRRVHPGITNTDVFLIADADNGARANAQTLGELKSAQAKAPSYLYYFTWRSPVHKGQMKAYHTLDIPFAFYNVDIASSMTGSGNDRYLLAHRMSAAWAAFARTGSPNHPDLPTWPAFNTTDWPTMILDDECRVAKDPNREERLALKAIRDTPRSTSSSL